MDKKDVKKLEDADKLDADKKDAAPVAENDNRDEEKKVDDVPAMPQLETTEAPVAETENKGKKPVKKKKAKAPKQPLEGTAGRKSPLQILREEKAKTIATREKFQVDFDQKHAVVEEKKQAMPVELEALAQQQEQEAAQKLGVSRENAERLTKSVEERGQTVKELKEKLEAELKALKTETKERDAAEVTLAKETAAVNQEQAKVYRAKQGELKSDLKAAEKEENTARSTMNKNVRKEKMGTFKNTLKGSLSYAFGLVAAVPDIIVRGARSLWGMAAETLGTFNRVAKRSSADYKKKTYFTKFRN